MAPKGAAKNVDPTSVDSAWKVLQMKMNETKQQSLAAKTTTTSKNPPAQKSHTRKRKQMFDQEKEAAKAKVSKVEADTLVLSSCRERGELTPILALDCEYVGVGSEGRDDSLARVSVVNEQGKVVYDKFVASKERIVDFRTQVSGIRAKDLVNAPSFESVRSEVHSLLSNRTIVGHALHNDFRVLQLNIPRKFSRDIAKSRFLRKESKSGDRPSLRGYAEKLLGIAIQDGEHDSIVDARVALRIYLLHKKQIEEELARYK